MSQPFESFREFFSSASAPPPPRVSDPPVPTTPPPTPSQGEWVNQALENTVGKDLLDENEPVERVKKMAQAAREGLSVNGNPPVDSSQLQAVVAVTAANVPLQQAQQYSRALRDLHRYMSIVDPETHGMIADGSNPRSKMFLDALTPEDQKWYKRLSQPDENNLKDVVAFMYEMVTRHYVTFKDSNAGVPTATEVQRYRNGTTLDSSRAVYIQLKAKEHLKDIKNVNLATLVAGRLFQTSHRTMFTIPIDTQLSTDVLDFFQYFAPILAHATNPFIDAVVAKLAKVTLESTKRTDMVDPWACGNVILSPPLLAARQEVVDFLAGCLPPHVKPSINNIRRDIYEPELIADVAWFIGARMTHTMATTGQRDAPVQRVFDLYANEQTAKVTLRKRFREFMAKQEGRKRI